jgi:hypothetical protein
MLKVSIEETLKEQKKKDFAHLNSDPVKEVKLLLQGDATEERRILQGLSNDSEFARIQNMTGRQIEIEKLEGTYDGNVFTREQIENLAIDYHLRFLEARYYTGTFDTQVASKIKNFAKSTNTPMDNHSLSRNYMILAPGECFSLQEERYISKRELDPAIFYRIDHNHYRLIHKWGKDFTILRLIEGWKWKSWSNFHLFYAAIYAPFVVALATIAFGNMYIFENPIRMILGIFAASNIAGFLFKSAWKLDDGSVIDGFFTPHNWNSDTKLVR